MKLEEVKWAYDGKAEGYRQTIVPGVLVSQEAFGDLPIPKALLDYGRQLQEYSQEEVDAETGEALLFSGRTIFWKGQQWWEFSTLSSYSVTLWVGKGEDGYLTTTEEL